jgi:hypothetical protein
MRNWQLAGKQRFPLEKATLLDAVEELAGEFKTKAFRVKGHK